MKHPAATTQGAPLVALGAAALVCTGCIRLFDARTMDALLDVLLGNLVSVANTSDTPVQVWGATLPPGAGEWAIDGPWEVPPGHGLVYSAQMLARDAEGDGPSLSAGDLPWPAYVYVLGPGGTGMWLDATGGPAVWGAGPGNRTGVYRPAWMSLEHGGEALPHELGDLPLPKRASVPAERQEEPWCPTSLPVVAPLRPRGSLGS